MPSELRFGVIGCGETAMQTCEGISAASNATIGMLMDVRQNLLDDVAEMFGAPTTTDLDEMLSSPDVDAVYIATPHYLHVPIGIEAARAGKHVLVEKPIATNLADADALISACQESGVKLGVAFHAQVDAAMTQARQLVQAGVLGEIIGTRISALGRKPDTYWHGGYTQRVRSDWRVSKEQSGGGILIMNVVHDLNTVRWVTGLEPFRIYAEYETSTTPVEVEDNIAVTIRYRNGAIGVIQAGSAMVGGEHEDARGPRIYGTKGQLILSAEPLIYLEEPLEGGEAKAWQKMRYSGPKGDRQQMVARYAQAVLEDSAPPVSGEDGRKALEIIAAAYLSGELARPVELGDL